MISWLLETYYWLWHDFLGMPHPFTWYFRIMAGQKKFWFWLPVALLVALALCIIVALIVVTVGLFRLKYHCSPFWRIVGEIVNIILIVAMWFWLFFLVWFILHIAKVAPFGIVRGAVWI